MLGLKIKKILLENEYAGKSPANMSQLAAIMGLSYKRVYEMVRRERQDDIERLAKGLGISPNQLSP